MAVEVALPQLGTILVTAAIDSINPCAIGVLILLVSTLLASAKNKDKMLRIGLLYIAVVYITYFLAGLGLIAFLTTIPQVIAEYIAITVGVIIVGAGLIEIKDFYWYGRGFSLAIPRKSAKKIHKYMQNITVPGIIFLGAFVAAVELPCTGGPYLAITLILAQNFNLTALVLLLIYNVIFVLPLVIILLAVTFGSTKIQDIERWRGANRASMRLYAGLLLIGLGWLLILIANGTINFG